MKIAVAGGTGVAGRHVVDVAGERGHEPVVLSRSAGVDLRDESAVASALGGVDAIVDAANISTLNGRKATAFFTEVTSRLSRLGAQAGASRLVLLSIVGIDRVAYAYYRAKLAQEDTARRGPLALTIVRATQFHEFPSQVLERSSFGPVAAVPVMLTQPIAARSVAEVLVRSVEERPRAETVDIAGPRSEHLIELVRATLRHRGQRRLIVPLWLPGAGGRAMRAGAGRPEENAELLGPTFAEWLARTPTTSTGP